MQTITIVTEKASEKELAAILPPSGIKSVTVTADRSGHRNTVAAQNFRGFCNPSRFSPNYRIELVVEDETVETVFDAIAFAYSTGFFNDAEAWVNAPAVAA